MPRRAKKPKRPPPLVPKALGVSAVDKTPWKSPAYRAHIRTFPCLGCRAQATQAHHIRESFPRTMGRRISDKYIIPLCEPCHTELHNNAVAFWMSRLGKIGDHFTIDWCEKTHREWSGRSANPTISPIGTRGSGRDRRSRVRRMGSGRSLSTDRRC